MPIINSLIERQRELVNHIFKDEPETHLRTDLENAWFSATMRQDDIVVLCANSDKVEQELKTVFPDNLNVDWYCEHPIRSVSIIK
jgi:hypothetical protein